MRDDLRELTIPFPTNLMATAQSPLALPTTYARELTNMLLAPDGSGMKRNGLTPVGSALAGEAITALFSFQHSSGLQLLCATDAGKLYRQNGSAWHLLYSGLNPTGQPQAVLFGGKLVLCNGFDPLVHYDGATVSVVERLVRDAGANLTLLGGTQFRLDSQATLYPTGSTVRLKVNGTDVLATVQNASQSGVQTTVTLTAAVLAASLTEAWFTVRPPAFSQLAVAHDRLWGFGAGGFGPSLGSGAERLRVYYTHGVNDPAAWPDPATGLIPSLNLADKAGVADELLALRVKDGLTVFLGRNHLQLWEGTNPGTSTGGAATLGWVKTLPVGIVHPHAVLDLPNDLLLLTPLGARTLARTLQTEQLDLADVGRALDPTLATAVAGLLVSPAAYRRGMQALRCPAQQWFAWGFAEETLVWQLGASGSGWARFIGGFAGLTAAHTAPDGTLYLAKAGQVYRYDLTTFADAGAPIFTRWWLPWVNPAGTRRWANKYLEVLAVPQVVQPITLQRYADLDDGNPRVLNLELPAPPDYWDSAAWDAALFDNATPPAARVRDHCVAERLALALESHHTLPLRVLGLKLYGIS
ncbi:MAG: hypothetical protein INF43_03630 [Alphaproteobacteria bacterium]|nr:hypothetical protein [Alphaproteobacteria bacterium]